MPKTFNCPLDAAAGKYKCNVRSLSHPLSIPELWFSTPAFAAGTFYVERTLMSNDELWWNRQHVGDKIKYEETESNLKVPSTDPTCEQKQNCWNKFKVRPVTARANLCAVLLHEYKY